MSADRIDLVTLTLTTRQREDLRAALVEHRNRLDKFKAAATHSCTAEYWDGHLRRYDDLLLLVAKA